MKEGQVFPGSRRSKKSILSSDVDDDQTSSDEGSSVDPNPSTPCLSFSSVASHFDSEFDHLSASQSGSEAGALIHSQSGSGFDGLDFGLETSLTLKKNQPETSLLPAQVSANATSLTTEPKISQTADVILCTSSDITICERLDTFPLGATVLATVGNLSAIITPEEKGAYFAAIVSVTEKQCQTEETEAENVASLPAQVSANATSLTTEPKISQTADVIYCTSSEITICERLDTFPSGATVLATVGNLSAIVTPQEKAAEVSVAEKQCQTEETEAENVALPAISKTEKTGSESAHFAELEEVSGAIEDVSDLKKFDVALLKASEPKRSPLEEILELEMNANNIEKESGGIEKFPMRSTRTELNDKAESLSIKLSDSVQVVSTGTGREITELEETDEQLHEASELDKFVKLARDVKKVEGVKVELPEVTELDKQVVGKHISEEVPEKFISEEVQFIGQIVSLKSVRQSEQADFHHSEVPDVESDLQILTDTTKEPIVDHPPDNSTDSSLQGDSIDGQELSLQKEVPLSSTSLAPVTPCELDGIGGTGDRTVEENVQTKEFRKADLLDGRSARLEFKEEKNESWSAKLSENFLTVTQNSDENLSSLSLADKESFIIVGKSPLCVNENSCQKEKQLGNNQNKLGKEPATEGCNWTDYLMRGKYLFEEDTQVKEKKEEIMEKNFYEDSQRKTLTVEKDFKEKHSQGEKEKEQNMAMDQYEDSWEAERIMKALDKGLNEEDYQKDAEKGQIEEGDFYKNDFLEEDQKDQTKKKDFTDEGPLKEEEEDDVEEDSLELKEDEDPAVQEELPLIEGDSLELEDQGEETMEEEVMEDNSEETERIKQRTKAQNDSSRKRFQEDTGQTKKMDLIEEAYQTKEKVEHPKKTDLTKKYSQETGRKKNTELKEEDHQEEEEKEKTESKDLTVDNSQEEEKLQTVKMNLSNEVPQEEEKKENAEEKTVTMNDSQEQEKPNAEDDLTEEDSLEQEETVEKELSVTEDSLELQQEDEPTEDEDLTEEDSLEKEEDDAQTVDEELSVTEEDEEMEEGEEPIIGAYLAEEDSQKVDRIKQSKEVEEDLNKVDSQGQGKQNEEKHLSKEVSFAEEKKEQTVEKKFTRKDYVEQEEEERQTDEKGLTGKDSVQGEEDNEQRKDSMQGKEENEQTWEKKITEEDSLEVQEAEEPTAGKYLTRLTEEDSHEADRIKFRTEVEDLNKFISQDQVKKEQNEDHLTEEAPVGWKEEEEPTMEKQLAGEVYMEVKEEEEQTLMRDLTQDYTDKQIINDSVDIRNVMFSESELLSCSVTNVIPERNVTKTTHERILQETTQLNPVQDIINDKAENIRAEKTANRINNKDETEKYVKDDGKTNVKDETVSAEEDDIRSTANMNRKTEKIEDEEKIAQVGEIGLIEKDET